MIIKGPKAEMSAIFLESYDKLACIALVVYPEMLYFEIH